MTERVVTLADTLNAIREQHERVNDGSQLLCAVCWGDRPWPCETHERAVAGLALLARIREHAEAVAEWHEVDPDDSYRCACSLGYPCPSMEHAEAILALVGETHA
jgi:hypothetical protein